MSATADIVVRNQNTARLRPRVFFLFALLSVMLFTSFAAIGAPAEPRPWQRGVTPPLVLKGIDGKSYDIRQFRGKVVLVNFWATWCEPCRDEMPSIRRLSEQMKDKPFTVLAVNVDEPEARIRRFMEEVSLPFPVLVDDGMEAVKAWNARILPSSFLVDRDGRVRYIVTGETDWSAPKLVKLVEGLTKHR